MPRTPYSALDLQPHIVCPVVELSTDQTLQITYDGTPYSWTWYAGTVTSLAEIMATVNADVDDGVVGWYWFVEPPDSGSYSQGLFVQVDNTGSAGTYAISFASATELQALFQFDNTTYNVLAGNVLHTESSPVQGAIYLYETGVSIKQAPIFRGTVGYSAGGQSYSVCVAGTTLAAVDVEVGIRATSAATHFQLAQFEALIASHLAAGKPVEWIYDPSPLMKITASATQYQSWRMLIEPPGPSVTKSLAGGDESQVLAAAGYAVDSVAWYTYQFRARLIASMTGSA